MRSFFLLLLLTALAYQTANASQQVTGDSTAPNILLILLDDLGFNDLGANGNPDVPTPNMNTLASQGIRFTRHYADTVCSPARVALLTGQFPERFGFRPAALGLSMDTPTIASALRDAGYHTQHIGKWHVGNATLQQSPSQVGFDDWFGALHQWELDGEKENFYQRGRPTYRDPYLRTNNSPTVQYKGHLTEILTDRAVEYLSGRAGSDQPWFLNLWYFAPHAPIQPGEKFSSKYPDNPAGQYYALIDQVDTAIGRVLGELERLGMAEDTMVVVLSDNGPSSKDTQSSHPYIGAKTGFHEGSFRTPLLIRWPGRVKPGIVRDDRASILDIFPTLAAASGASSTGDLIGNNLLGDESQNYTLFWEWPDSSRFSVLSPDGRWRLSKYGNAEKPMLFDLDMDYSGFLNVADRHPQVVDWLLSEYRKLHNRERSVDFIYSRYDPKGGAILRGNDIQRSPGYRDFTFAIGVTPEYGNDKQEMIAHQLSRWSLKLNDDNQLRLRIEDIEIKGSELPEGKCSAVAVSSRFSFPLLHPNRSEASIKLYVNGELVAEQTVKKPQLRTWGYTNPTYIGTHSNGSKRFHGSLTKPVILNERLVPDGQGNFLKLNEISTLPPLCQANGADDR